MTARLLTAAAGGLATIAAAGSLVPLVAGGDWTGQGVALVTAVVAAGSLLRATGTARPVVVLAQSLFAFAMLLVMLVSRVSGPLPTPGALRAYAGLLAAGGDDIGRYAPPVPATEGVTAILLTAVAVVAIAVDAVAVTYGQAAAAGLPLLALYSVPAALAEGRLGLRVFVVAAGAYVLLLLAEGHERAARWGRVLGPGGRGGPARAGAGIAVAALSAAAVLPPVIPLGENRLAGDDRGGGPRTAVTAVDPLVTLRDNLRRGEDTELLRYTTDAARPGDLYLRVSVLDRFDGATWSASERRVTPLPAALPPPPGLAPDVAAAMVRTRFRAADGFRQNALPLPYPASEVSARGDWRYDDEGRSVVGEGGQTASGLSWTVTSLDTRPTAAQLTGAAASDGTDLSRYRRLPTAIERQITPVARGVAREGTPYEQALRLEAWFTGGDFTYDTAVPAGQASTLAAFLENRAGYCEHFATAMAVMARSLGIPARVVVGFTPGTRQADGTYVVTAHDAHAWPELYFPGSGWTRFEPTPSRGSAPPRGVTGAEPVAPPPAPSATASAAPQPSAAPSATCRPGDPAACSQAETAVTPSAGRGGGGETWWIAAALGLGAVAGCCAAVPALLRARRRRRRLAPAGPADDPDAGRGPVLAAWDEVLDTARDVGLRAGPAATPRSVAARLSAVLAAPAAGHGALAAEDAADADGTAGATAGARTGATAGARTGSAAGGVAGGTARPVPPARGGRDGGSAAPGDRESGTAVPGGAAALARLAAATERVLYAPGPAGAPPPGLADDVRAVRAALLASAPRARRLRARVLPPSVLAPRGAGAGGGRDDRANRHGGGDETEAAGAASPGRPG